MAICIERLCRTLVTEEGLDCLHACAVADEQAGVEMAEVVKRDLVTEAGGASSLPKRSLSNVASGVEKLDLQLVREEVISVLRPLA